jgi:hypothetical protein
LVLKQLISETTPKNHPKTCDSGPDLEDSNIGPGTQTKPINGGFQETLAFLINRTELLDVAIGHLTVAIDLVTLESA